MIRYLGSSGKAKIEESEKGWWITWIDRDPETVARQEALAKRDKMSKDDDERMADFVAKQVERQREKCGQDLEEDKYTELVRMSEDEKISIGNRAAAIIKILELIKANLTIAVEVHPEVTYRF